MAILIYIYLLGGYYKKNELNFSCGPLKKVCKEEFQGCSEQWCPSRTRQHSGPGLILREPHSLSMPVLGMSLKGASCLRLSVALPLIDSVNIVSLWARPPAHRQVEALVLRGIKSHERGGLGQKVFFICFPKLDSMPDNGTLADLVCMFALALSTVDFGNNSRLAWI